MTYAFLTTVVTFVLLSLLSITLSTFDNSSLEKSSFNHLLKPYSMTKITAINGNDVTIASVCTVFNGASMNIIVKGTAASIRHQNKRNAVGGLASSSN